jgi:hypothetical protein
VKQWEKYQKLILGERNVVHDLAADAVEVLLPSLHITFGLVKHFVKVRVTGFSDFVHRLVF